MARYTDARCKLCRREGTKLFLKGERCNSAKCAFEKRSYPPGERGKEINRKPSGYAIHLREKQKVRRIYGILERQFRGYFDKASRMKGVTGENLLSLLERRMDNVVFRMGMAPSRSAARQLVGHKHFLVNEKVVNIPSYLIKPGDVIKVKDKSKENIIIKESLDKNKSRALVSWLKYEPATMSGSLLNVPTRDTIGLPINEQLIIELYSK
ncbi:MAG: 30S ribosomal protein S4 [Candidatus Edwardsbacteria bacterium]|nr:30S ribosomal protein S4 [Candidatus Edwardsbacteria bacterium]MBU1576729.1 30S ribosomal protein S4 [Candidatus Edwardsbacteria bacterium]MBU2464513.1 30S ribosomal protein S4 [Candidatus Edwardsbacteria bacterium]MBU2594804.1 30S ribosomal protein S4 [Candidatus Edwardsbacteria bacterium]